MNRTPTVSIIKAHILDSDLRRNSTESDLNRTPTVSMTKD